jgi:hypothetical protein
MGLKMSLALSGGYVVWRGSIGKIITILKVKGIRNIPYQCTKYFGKKV